MGKVTVDTDRWQRAKDLFGSALEREPGQRSAYLAEACRGDETLRQEIESLLAAHEEAGTTAGSIAKDSLSGHRIGPYQLMHRIGQGGMAMVYLATRADEQYRKCVAIKLILPGLQTDDLLRRFRNERQTLAALDHPNIVKLLDGGETEDRLPYLVMDYVEGTPITDYCDARRLFTADRLFLFRTVCGAISYAHQRLVIHRDLKPGNILITADGTPKLLDFGIAKLLNPEAAATLVVTRTGERLMTPDYASPEQVRGEPLTNSTDVYSLGAVLYELLTGRRPYRFKAQSPLEIERAICEEEPLKPSTAVTRPHERTTADGTSIVVTPEAVSRTREGDPKKLSSRLHGDLDAIVMMALRKEPQRRYSSVSEFSEDIRHHLEGLPVKARPSTVSYRTSKFVRRHRELTMASVIFLLLLGGVTTWQARRRALEPDANAHSRRTPEVRRSVAVLGFKNLSGRPDVGWISGALSRTLTTELGQGGRLRTIPGESVAKMKVSLSLPDADALAPSTLVQIRRSLGNDLVVLGSYIDLPDGQIRVDLRLQDTQSGGTIAEMSETGTEPGLFDLLSRTGVELREKLGIGPVTIGEAANVRASLPANPEATRLYVEGFTKLSVFDALSARALLHKAIALDPNFALSHSSLADALSSLGYNQEARIEAKRAFDLSTNLSREDRLWIEGRYRKVNAEWEKAAEIYSRLFSAAQDNVDYGLELAGTETIAGHPKDAMITLASLHKLPPPLGDDPRIDLAEADAAESRADYKQELEMATKSLTKAEARGARLIVARALYLQSYAWLNLGDYNRAMEAAGKAKETYDATGDQGHVAEVLDGVLATIAARQGDLDGALRNNDEALAIVRRIGNKLGLASALNNRATFLGQRGDLVGAKRMFEQALTIYEEVGNRQSTADSSYNIAEVLLDEGNLNGANRMFDKVLTLYREVGNQGGVAYCLREKAQVAMLQGNLSISRRLATDALNIFQQISDRQNTASALVQLGQLSLVQDDLTRSRQRYAQALEIQEETGEKIGAAETRIAMAELALNEGHAAEAVAPIQQALQEFRERRVTDDEVSATVLLARVWLALGRHTDAEKGIEGLMTTATKSEKFVAKIEFTIVGAEVSAALGQFQRAESRVETALAKATSAGDLHHQFEARFVMATTKIQAGQTAVGQAQLIALQKEAQAKGFNLIAHKAVAGLRS